MASALGLVLIVLRRREERAFPLASAVHQGHAFLFSVQGGVVIAGQRQVGGDAFPEAIAEKGLIHAEWVSRSLGVLLQSASGKKEGRGRREREGHRGVEDKGMRKRRDKRGWLVFL